MIMGLEVASIHFVLGSCLGCRLVCMSLQLVGLKVAGTRESKNKRFIGAAVDHVSVAGAYGSVAVSGG